MKKRITIAVSITIVVAFYVALMSSCGKIHEGTVIDKYVIKAHSYKYSTVIIVGKVPIITWHTGYVDDEYVLIIKDAKNDLESIAVPENTYECISIGDMFNEKMNSEDDYKKMI